jgi:hypothetical protein
MRAIFFPSIKLYYKIECFKKLDWGHGSSDKAPA